MDDADPRRGRASPEHDPPIPWSESPGDVRLRTFVAAARVRLAREAGLDAAPVVHYRRPVERPFTAAERDRVTILVGGLTWKHDRLIKAVFEGSGYRCENLPTPDAAACQLGRMYGNVGQCNPTYFTAGSLIRYLLDLEASDLSREEIVDRYVFFTSGSCGPCRFGMYESEYRLALANAGFDGFRVLLFQQNDGMKATSGEPGLKFTVDFGLNALNAFLFGDALHDLIHQIRPYEVTPGATQAALGDVVDDLVRLVRDEPRFEIREQVAPWFARFLTVHRLPRYTVDAIGKISRHLYGRGRRDALARGRERLDGVEVDRLRVKPVVKVVGEFWAQTTEGDGNFDMFAFLEQEGAQVLVDPIGNWVLYLLHQRRLNAAAVRAVACARAVPWWRHVPARLAADLRYRRQAFVWGLGEALWSRQYDRVGRALGGLAHPAVPQRALARLAHPFYHQLARGGEGHLEVGKSIYYTTEHLCHMVLSLKPFGCMPSTQSDGVHAAVVARHPDMIFLSIETSGEGSVEAHSRVQMALGEARARARREFDEALARTGRRLNDIRDYVASHPALRRPFYRVPRRRGVVGTAANFVLHVGDLMDGRRGGSRVRASGRPRHAVPSLARR